MTQLKSTPAVETFVAAPSTSVEVKRVAVAVPPDTANLNVPHHGAVVAKGLAQTFGLAPSAAALTIIVDMMLFGGEVASFGVLIVLSAIVSAVLAFIIYKIQIHWYEDEHDSALIKALIVGLVTAIPTPLTPLIALPCGFLGLVRMVRGRN